MSKLFTNVAYFQQNETKDFLGWQLLTLCVEFGHQQLILTSKKIQPLTNNSKRTHPYLQIVICITHVSY